MKIDVAIELIIPDNTAFTVLRALRQLGYAELASVERSDHVFLTVPDAAPVEKVVEQLSRAEVLFNPNKHRLSYAAQSAKDVAPPEFEALVRERDENTERLRALLVTTFGMAALGGLERAVGWRLWEAGSSASRERLEWACKTLLANPVSQRFEIRRRPVRMQVGEPAIPTAKTVQ